MTTTETQKLTALIQAAKDAYTQLMEAANSLRKVQCVESDLYDSVLSSHTLLESSAYELSEKTADAEAILREHQSRAVGEVGSTPPANSEAVQAAKKARRKIELPDGTHDNSDAAVWERACAYWHSCAVEFQAELIKREHAFKTLLDKEGGGAAAIISDATEEIHLLQAALAEKEEELTIAHSNIQTWQDQYQAEHSLVLTCYDQLREERNKIETLIRADNEHAHGVRDVCEQLAAANKRIEELYKELREMEHKVITCGVAATHPDAALTMKYPNEWQSKQADEVRELRARADNAEYERDRLLEALTNYVNADDWTEQLEANALEVISAIYSREVAQAALATPGDAEGHQSTAPEENSADFCKKNDPVFLTEQQPGDAASLSALYSSFCEDEMSSEQLAAARKKYDDYVQRTLKPQPQAGDAPREL